MDEDRVAENLRLLQSIAEDLLDAIAEARADLGVPA